MPYRATVTMMELAIPRSRLNPLLYGLYLDISKWSYHDILLLDRISVFL